MSKLSKCMVRHSPTRMPVLAITSIAMARSGSSTFHAESNTARRSAFERGSGLLSTLLFLLGRIRFSNPCAGLTWTLALSIASENTPEITAWTTSTIFADRISRPDARDLGAGDLDWNGDIRPGPLDIGFDHCFLIPATGDRVPCVYVEDRRVAGLDPSDPIRVSYREPVDSEPTGRDHPELLKMHPSAGHDQTIVNGISRIGFMTGGQKARWTDETMADAFAEKGLDFIGRSASRPFLAAQKLDATTATPLEIWMTSVTPATAFAAASSTLATLPPTMPPSTAPMAVGASPPCPMALPITPPATAPTTCPATRSPR